MSSVDARARSNLGNRLRGFFTRLREELRSPAQLVALVVLPVFWLAREADLIADVPMWGLLALLLGAQLLSTVTHALWPRDVGGWRLFVRVGVEMGVIYVIIYAIGWGPTLAIGVLFGAVDNIRVSGSKAAPAATFWAVAGIAVGQVAILLGIAPTLVPEPLVDGLALLAALGAAFTIDLFGRTTEQKERAEAEARPSEQRFRALVQHSADLILVLHEDTTIAYASPEFERVTGTAPAAALGQPTLEFLDPEDTAGAERFYADVAASPGEVRQTELRLQAPNGTARWFDIGATNLLDDPDVGGIVLNLHDVTERRAFEERLKHDAYHDALTGLPNRILFLEHLRRALRRAVPGRPTQAVLFLDVDRFKNVNDSLGHEVGDRLLVEMAERLRACLRPGDEVARFGGDEFTVLLERVRQEGDVVAASERILQALHEPFVIDGRPLFVTGSIGIALAPSEGGGDAGEMLRAADLAMYVAKGKGRARWEFYDPASAPRVAERLELEGELWRAVRRAELVVHFQPEVSLADGEIHGVEALVRWEHPDRGLLMPSAFIPVAEESSLIVAIDRHVLMAACAAASRWRNRDGDPVTVGVNVSPRFLRDASAIDDIDAVLAETQLDPTSLQLEITERSTLADEIRTLDSLGALRARGVRIAIDDFGTGYSSFEYLNRFPLIDVLKIDRNFVVGLDGGTRSAAIVEAVITMGHALGMRVTAEGVERADQAEQLRGMGCDGAQGFHFAAALPAARVAELLGRHPEGRTSGQVVPFPRRGTA